jgi:hypothetical protein
LAPPQHGAPHPLAEAICELAAPPLAPTYLRLQACRGDTPSFAVVLHLRPRHHAAGLESAVHCAAANVEVEGIACYVHAAEAGALYAVPQTAAGIEAFVADLINTGSWETGYGDQTLCLPERYYRFDSWSAIQVQLCAASSVVATSRPYAGCVVLKFPMPFQVSTDESVCCVRVQNASSNYARQQEALKLPQPQRDQQLRQLQWLHVCGMWPVSGQPGLHQISQSKIEPNARSNQARGEAMQNKTKRTSEGPPQLAEHESADVFLHPKSEVQMAKGQDAEGAGHPRRPQVMHVLQHAGGGDDAVCGARQQVHRHVQQAVILCRQRQGAEGRGDAERVCCTAAEEALCEQGLESTCLPPSLCRASIL